jgi:hypothetical protein
MRRFYFVVTLAGFFIGCDYITDIEPPEVKIIKPQEGERITEVVEVETESSDNKELAKVVLYIDGKEVATSTDENPKLCVPVEVSALDIVLSPYDDSSKLRNFVVKAYDRGGNWSCDEVKDIRIVPTPKFIFAGYEFYSEIDTVVNPGDTVKLEIELTNIGTGCATAKFVVTTDDEYTAVIDSTGAIWAAICPGDTTYQMGPDKVIKFAISESCPASHIIRFQLDIEDHRGNHWADEFEIKVYEGKVR